MVGLSPLPLITVFLKGHNIGIRAFQSLDLETRSKAKQRKVAEKGKVTDLMDDSEIHSSSDSPSPQSLEVALKALLDNDSSKVDSLCHQHSLQISENSRSIAELHDMISGLSLQITQAFAEKVGPSVAIKSTGPIQSTSRNNVVINPSIPSFNESGGDFS